MGQNFLDIQYIAISKLDFVLDFPLFASPRHQNFVCSNDNENKYPITRQYISSQRAEYYCRSNICIQPEYKVDHIRVLKS